MSLRNVPLPLKVGIAMMLSALVLAVGVAVAVGLRSSQPDPMSASAEPVSAQSTTQEKNKSKAEPDRGKKLEINEEETTVNEEETTAETNNPLPDLAQEWERPSTNEVAATNAPRYYQPQRDSTLALTVDKIGLYDVPVINSDTLEALDRSVIHLPKTPMPWEEREQKNVYLAGHRLGYEGTGSRMVFYNLDKLKKGDSVFLEDSLGTPYEYRVSEVFVTEPDAEWVVDPVRGRDMVTLQTCTMPDFKNRIIVRADRI